MDSRPRLRRIQGEERKAVPDVRRQAPQGDLRGIDPVLPGSVPERPAGDATFSTPTTRSSTTRWRSTTAFPASPARNGGASTACGNIGRGGILGLASVQAKQAGASRTSPVLRGNWVVETLLGEKLPRPPANVPRLPEEEGGNDGLTMRQLVEKHAERRRVRRLPSAHRPVRLRPGEVRPDRPAARQGPRRPGGRRQGEAQGRHRVRRHRRVCGRTC